MRLVLVCSLAWLLSACSGPSTAPVSDTHQAPAPAAADEEMPVATIDQTIAQFIATNPATTRFAAATQAAPADAPARNQAGDANVHALVIVPTDEAMQAYAASSAKLSDAELVASLTVPLDGPTPIQKMGDRLVAARGDLSLPTTTGGQLRVIGANPWRVRNQAGEEAKVQTFYMTKHGNIVLLVDKVVAP